MNGIGRILSNCMAAAVLVAVLLPQSVQAQGQNPMVLGVGVGRFVPLKPLASPDAGDFKLDGVGASVFAVDYWFSGWLGARASYAWLRTSLAEPNLPSSARMNAVYSALLVSPVSIVRGVRPYVALGGGVRRYDVNARLVTGTETWDIAPRQWRPAAFTGAGITLRRGRFQIAPEAGLLMNSFRNEAGCRGCVERDRQMDMLVTLQLQLR